VPEIDKSHPLIFIFFNGYFDTPTISFIKKIAAFKRIKHNGHVKAKTASI